MTYTSTYRLVFFASLNVDKNLISFLIPTKILHSLIFDTALQIFITCKLFTKILLRLNCLARNPKVSLWWQQSNSSSFLNL